MINNVAAGSDSRFGVGIWYLFPDKPVGESANLDLFFKPKQAKHTPINQFKDNVAHSNGNIGLALFRRLGPEHNIIGCSTYSPKENPLNRNWDFVPIFFDGFTGTV